MTRLNDVLKHVDVNRQDHEGYSPVHMAILHSDRDENQTCLSLLLSEGASPDEDSIGCPLKLALDNQDRDIIIQLLAHGAMPVRSSDGHLPLNLYGDSHAAFPEGQSMLVSVAKTCKEEAVQKGLAKMKMKFPATKRYNCGVYHLIINHSDVTCLLHTKKNKELLEIFAPSFSSSNFSKEGGEALTRELGDLGIKIEEPTIWIGGERGGEMWSDGESYHHEKKRLTGIQVAESGGGKILRLRVAFNNGEWGRWRDTAKEYETPDYERPDCVEQPALLLQDGEEIIGATTHTNDDGKKQTRLLVRRKDY